MTKLWPDERINSYSGNASSAWEARRLFDAMKRVADDYEAEIDKLVTYCLSLEGQIEVLKRRIPHVVKADTPMNFQEAAAAVRAEFGNFSFLNKATPK